METNEISMFMDAKLDIHESKNSEATKLQTWTKCLVKIEAIKCFPCYLRITFIRNIEDESANLCVRINIPGISIRLASSRTKSYSYGIFWKHNRKRCCIFFAFGTETSCERHMKWFKSSLKNLELHRQQMIETKRTSCNSITDLTNSLKMTSFVNVSGDKNLQDILGPLPKVPDIRESNNWSRRISGMSDIYEEIIDNRRLSRASGIYEEMKAPIEPELFRNKNFELPPPLPPRKRVDTYQAESELLYRCNTNPESEMPKNKNIHQQTNGKVLPIPGRSQRSESVSEGQVSTCEELIDSINTPDKASVIAAGSSSQSHSNQVTPRTKRKFPYIFNNRNKRNSFSSPDLSKINPFEDFETLDDLSSLSSELHFFNSNDCFSSPGDDLNEIANAHNTVPIPNKIEIKSENISEDVDKNDENNVLNISDQITSNFNFSCNSSTINLVGANLIPTQSIGNILIEDDLSGYCTMAPIIPKDVNKKEESSVYMEHSSEVNKKLLSIENNDSSDKENDYLFKPPLCTKNPKIIKLDQRIYENVKYLNLEDRNSLNNNNIYQNMSIVEKPDLIPIIEVTACDKSDAIENNDNLKKLDEPKTPVENHVNDIDDNDDDDDDDDEEEEYYKTPRKTILSIDDKVPSYYPNSCDTKKSYRHRSDSNSSADQQQNPLISHLTNAKLTHKENLYISSPQKILDQRKKINKNHNKFEQTTPIKAYKISKNIYGVKRLTTEDNKELENNFEEDNKLIGSALNNIGFKFDEKNVKNIDGNVKCNRLVDVKKRPLIKASAILKTETQQKLPSATQRMYQKSSTMVRVTPPNKFEENKCVGPSNSGSKIKSSTAITTSESGMKKFASLPRFKKIDFSPLKIKINNVLQRNQSDGL